MSSSRVKDQTVEEIDAKTSKDTERCGTGRPSRLPTHARSPSTSGQKSKIPTNIGLAGRPGGAATHQPADNSRTLTSVASDEAAICNASPINSGRFPISKSLTTASSPSAVSKMNKSLINSAGNSAMVKRQWENQFTTKRKRYATLKKELTDKQKNAADLYDEMSQLREKLMTNGARDPGKIETINLTGIPPIHNCPTRLPIIDSHAFRGSGEHVFAENSSLTSDLVSSTISKIRDGSKRSHDLCDETLRKNSEIFQLLVNLTTTKDESKIDEEIVKQIEAHKSEISKLESCLVETKKFDETLMNETMEKLSSLWKEVELSRERIRQLESINDEITNETRIKLDEALAIKKSAEDECEQLRERKTNLETEMQKLRAKIRGIEARASEDETKIGQLQNNVKSLESQLKQKESFGEQRSRDLQKSLKNSEILLIKTEKQRDGFESRLSELKKTVSLRENETEIRIKELSEKLGVVETELAKEREESRTRDGNTELDGVLNEDLESRLSERDEKITMLKREKEEILMAVKLIFGDESGLKFHEDNDDRGHDKIVEALTKKLQDFRSNHRLTQEKNENLQRQLAELRSRLHGQSAKDNDAKSLWSDRVLDMEKQVFELRCSVTELTRRNEDLEIALNQKQLEIEEQDRVMRERGNVLKVRDEVIGLIKGKTDSRVNSGVSGHLSLVKKKNNQRDREQVDKQIAEKTENLQQLYTTLETKQMQITRLEELVQQMETQQERAQEQRTRLEKKIAQLQLAIHYKKAHRSRGWLSIL